MDNNLGVTIRLTLKTWQTLSNGENPVVICVTWKRKRKYFSTGVSCDRRDWMDDRGEIFRKTRENNRLSDKLSQTHDALVRMSRIYDEFDFEKFDEFMGKKKEGHLMEKFWGTVVSSLHKEGRHGTASSYNDALKKFILFQGRKKFTLEQITPEVFENFRIYMINSGQKINGVGIYLRSMKAVYGRALERHLVTPQSDPRKSLRIKVEKTPKKALKPDQFVAIRDADLSELTRYRESHLMFMFSYYMQGMNFKDMCELKWSDHMVGERIVYQRSKTSHPFSIKIRPAMQEILKNLKGIRDLALFEKKIRSKEGADRILRTYDRLTESQLQKEDYKKKLRNQRAKVIKSHLNQIVTKLGIKFTPVELKLLTFYSARHTYATNLKYANAPMELIAEALGHSDIRTTQTYLDSFGNDQIDKFNDLIL